jgi:superfamily II DNA or RNA helicase
VASSEAANASPGPGAGAHNVDSSGKLDYATKNSAIGQPVKLRDYQLNSVAQIRAAYVGGAQHVLFQLPTGGGKTICFAYIVANGVARGTWILILVHRVELISQVAAALELAGVVYGVIAPGFAETNAQVQIASVACLAQPRRLARWAGKFDLIVIDEAHHAVASTWARVLASQPDARLLGVTATPARLDGRGLGEIFDDMIVGPPTAELIAAEWLSPFVVYEPTSAPDMSAAKIRAGDFSIEDQREAMGGIVVSAAVDEYQRLCPGVPTVVFCVDVQHSRAVAERFRAAGWRGRDCGPI